MPNALRQAHNSIADRINQQLVGIVSTASIVTHHDCSLALGFVQVTVNGTSDPFSTNLEGADAGEAFTVNLETLMRRERRTSLIL